MQCFEEKMSGVIQLGNVKLLVAIWVSSLSYFRDIPVGMIWEEMALFSLC